jgi:hypothetical protein
MGRKGWLIFALCQILGAWIPTFTNIHSNVAPLFASLLLVPGVAVWFVFESNGWWNLLLAVPINALVWHWIVRRFKNSRELI